MQFEFLAESRNIMVHHLDENNIYINSGNMLIQAGEGLPAQSTVVALTDYGKDEVLQLQSNNTWLVLTNHIGKTLYSKDRDEAKSYMVKEMGSIPITHTLLQPAPFDSWNEVLSEWQYDETRYRPVFIEEETEWQITILTKVEAELLFYAQDKQIPEIYSELRRTNYTVDEYYALLGDRKLLSDYVIQDDFPECGRPTLSGLTK